jgi:hypothetical protein
MWLFPRREVAALVNLVVVDEFEYDFSAQFSGQ